MRVLAGTTSGLFAIENGAAVPVLDDHCVRDILYTNESVYAGTDAGVYKSVDFGTTWSLQGITDRVTWQIRDGSDGILYAGTQPSALFRSDDAGESWHEIRSLAVAPEATAWSFPTTPAQPARARTLVIDRNDPGQIWVGIEVGGIMRTIDGGQTWHLTVPGHNPDLHNMCAHPDCPRMLFATTGYGRLHDDKFGVSTGVFRSQDYGTSWQYVWHGIQPQYVRPLCIDPRPPHAITVVAAPSASSSFEDDGGAQAILFRSDDEGKSWRSLCDRVHSPSRENIHGLTPDPEIPGGVVVGTDAGQVWRVSDDAEWTRLSSGSPAVLSVVAF